MNYSDISKSITKKLSKKDKKENGIFFTPPSCINKNIALIKKYIKYGFQILEPSCGSGEYITALDQHFKNIFITGIEYNKTIFESIQHLKFKDIVQFFKKGDVLVHHSNLIHRAGKNNTKNRRRRAIGLVFMPKKSYIDKKLIRLGIWIKLLGKIYT